MNRFHPGLRRAPRASGTEHFSVPQEAALDVNAAPSVGIRFSLAMALAALGAAIGVPAQDVRIDVRADERIGQVSRLLTGACLEDGNHEVYGGIYSQMIFGESFQEPPPSAPSKGFTAFGGSWVVIDGELSGSAGDGPKLVSVHPGVDRGEAGVDVGFDDFKPGNAGLIVRVGNAGHGADNFDGYEVSLDPSAQVLRLGRHRHNWTLIKDTPCKVPVGRWIRLAVKLDGSTLEVRVDGRLVIRHDDGAAALRSGTVGLRQWQREARYRKLWVATARDGAASERQALAFEPPAQETADISGMSRDCSGRARHPQASFGRRSRAPMAPACLPSSGWRFGPATGSGLSSSSPQASMKAAGGSRSR
ncbi:MAG: DUF1080 domain-containing protein [Verrucomicrobia bacterium]|nr:DUF1080 domain-containing protein [Verrucomicrobiota bacterium]